jgi:hypothetical protein
MTFAPQEQVFEEEDIKAEERRRRVEMNNYRLNESGGHRAGGHRQEGSESSDSVDFTEKRRNMVFESGDFGELAFHDLRKSGTF